MTRRARPMLGTIAQIETDDLSASAIDAAFAAAAKVQALMSLFDDRSDLARLHATPCGRPVEVAPQTAHVLGFALTLSAKTKGLFDVARGGEMSARANGPRPHRALYGQSQAQGATWRDLSLEGHLVTLGRPLWLNLNGIAKGYAVDQSIASLKANGARRGVVNIGGDLACFGPDVTPVTLRTTVPGAPVIDLENAALASSGGAADRVATRHLNGRSCTKVQSDRFATVVASDCMSADALTKVVLAEPVDLENLLALYGANAVLHTGTEWRIIGMETVYG